MRCCVWMRALHNANTHCAPLWNEEYGPFEENWWFLLFLEPQLITKLYNFAKVFEWHKYFLHFVEDGMLRWQKLLYSPHNLDCLTECSFGVRAILKFHIDTLRAVPSYLQRYSLLSIEKPAAGTCWMNQYEKWGKNSLLQFLNTTKRQLRSKVFHSLKLDV